MNLKERLKYSIHNVKDSSIDYVVVRESADKYERVERYEVTIHAYDKDVEVIYASHKQEVLDGLDSLIALLQGLRQDADLTYKD